MTEPDAELTEVFRDEAAERLSEMDAALMAVESGDAGAETVDALFRHAHSIKGAAGMLGFDDIRTLAHAVEDVFGAIRAAGRFPPELAAPLLRATAALSAHASGAREPIDGLLAELAAARESAAGAGTAPGPGQPAGNGPEPGHPEPEHPEPEHPEPEHPEPEHPEPEHPEPERPQPERPQPGGHAPLPGPGEAGPEPAGRRTLRVPAGRIDHLLDVVGEVMQDRRRLAHSLAGGRGQRAETADVLQAGDRMLEELKDTAVAMRTLPLATITGPLPRTVRDLARGAGKEADLEITGADTELDRVILESLSEPLQHLLRNAVSHGIEPPAERARGGKPERGHIALRAVPRGSQVEIVVEDDGRGVPAEVAAEARREGSLTDLLTRPGYTTAPAVTEVAGRGVGLDAVRSYVLSLGGSLEVESEPGRGMAVRLRLPLALALLEVLLLRRGNAMYGVPLSAVAEVTAVTRPLRLQGRAAVDIRGRALPLADLAAIIGAAASALGDRPPAVVVSAAGRSAVISCDELAGQAEVVVKPLGPLFAGVPGYLGAAILEDGRVALLADPAMLTRGSARPGAVPAPAPPPVPAPAPPLVPAVLVVEDSFTVRELQRSILETAGYPVVTARDGRDALAALDRRPDIALVITDLEMPGLDGLGLTRAIRGDPARSSLPVVIVTSHGSDEDRRQGIEAGADAYVIKRDFDQQALLATVARLTGR